MSICAECIGCLVQVLSLQEGPDCARRLLLLLLLQLACELTELLATCQHDISKRSRQLT
jgi:hypothetical protein